MKQDTDPHAGPVQHINEFNGQYEKMQKELRKTQAAPGSPGGRPSAWSGGKRFPGVGVRGGN